MIKYLMKTHNNIYSNETNQRNLTYWPQTSIQQQQQGQQFQNTSLISDGQSSQSDHDYQQLNKQVQKIFESASQDYFGYSYSNQLVHSLQSTNDDSQIQKYAQNNWQSSQASLIDLSCSFDQSQPQSFKQIVSYLQKHSITAFRNIWNQTNFSNKLNYILQSWPNFVFQYQDSLKIFANFIKYRIECTSIYKQIFPGLQKITDKIQKKVQHNNRTIQFNRSAQLQNVIYAHFLKEQQAKTQKLGLYFIKDEKSDIKWQLGQYIVQKKMYQQNLQEWKMLFFQGAALKRYNIEVVEKQEAKKQCRKVYKFANLLLNNHEMVQPSQFICCAKFFYLKFNISPFSNNNLICKSKMPNLKERVDQQVAFLQQKNKKTKDSSTQKKRDKNIKQEQIRSNQRDYKEQMKDVMLDVCALLNRGGGVVLFFTENKYLQIWPMGECILESKKQLYVKLITQSLRDIRPKISVGNQIKINFVPVVENPYERGYRLFSSQKEERQHQRLYIQGLYILRITVVPSQAQKLYYYQINEHQIQSAIIQNRIRKILKGQQMLMQMKRKFQQFYISDVECNNDPETRQLLSKQFTFTDKNHKCPQPQIGWPMEYREPAKIQKNEKFTYMSMIVAHKSNFTEITNRLKTKGIQSEISCDFQNLGFKSSSSSAPIFHNVKFDQLLKQVAYNKEFQFNGKYLLVIMVTTYIKLLDKTDNNRLLDADCRTLQGWLDKRFPGQNDKIQQFQFINQEGKIQYYVKTKNRLSTIFIYYVMHHSKQKIIFKNPKNFDKMSPQQKNSKWKRVYPNTQ